MKLTPPKPIVWWIALICALIGLLSALHIILVPALAGHIFWIVLGGLILLLLGNVFRGL